MGYDRGSRDRETPRCTSCGGPTRGGAGTASIVSGDTRVTLRMIHFRECLDCGDRVYSARGRARAAALVVGLRDSVRESSRVTRI